MTDTISPVFGTYGLPALRGALSGFCSPAADNRFGRWYDSLLRKTATVRLYSLTLWKAAKDAGKLLKALAVGGEQSRGEVWIAEADIVDTQHVDKIDAMKVDVEGHDFAALQAFFQQAPKTMWPKLLIIETGRGPSKVLELCVTNGYSLDRRTRINAILTLSDPAGNE